MRQFSAPVPSTLQGRRGGWPVREPRPGRSASRTLPVLLDLTRFSTALVVLASHYGPAMFGASPATFPGWDAVVVFFVLSGYLTAQAHDAGRPTLRGYALDNLARLWSIAVPAAALGLVAAAMSAMSSGEGLAPALSRTAAMLTFTGEGWFGVTAPYNPPMWRLHYEAWYCAAFAAWMFVPGRAAYGTMALLACLAGPGVIALAPCWVLGVALYRARDRLVLPPGLAVLVLVGCAAAYALAYGAHTTPALRDWLQAATHGQSHRLGEAMPVLGAYLLLPIIAAALVAMASLREPGRLLTVLTRPIQWGASLALSLYLLHMPVLHLLRDGLGLGHGGGLGAAVTTLVALLCIIALGMTLEPRRRLWRRGLAVAWAWTARRRTSWA